MRHRTRNSTRTTAVAAAILLVVAGCGGTADAPAADTGRSAASDAPQPVPVAFGLVSVDEAVELVGLDGVTVIDVRTPEEYAEGHLEGALLIDLNGPSFESEIAELDPEGSYLVYCRSGNRSARAVELMRQVGISNIWDMDGGVIGYTQAGYSLRN